MALFSIGLSFALWPKRVTRPALAWAGLAPIWMPNLPIMNTVLARLAWPGHQAQTVATASFSSALTDVATLLVNIRFGDK